MGWFSFNTAIVFSPQQSQREILKVKEGEEKQRRAREAREKAEAEKAARAARKKALVDMNAHGEGVMDSLMEALHDGSAFSRPNQQRRKRPTRAAGGKFYKATYVWRRMKKDRASQRCIFSSNLYESAKLKHGPVNITPHAIARHDVVQRIARVQSTANDSMSCLTPEENQELYEQILDEAKRTPKPKRMSRITYFKRKRQCSNCNRSYFTTLPINDDETPRRNILLNTFANLESGCIANETDSNECIDENVLFLNEARMLSPVKQRRVVVSKIRRRNSIVRRAILNRRRMRENVKRRRSHTRLHSPCSMSINMPPDVNLSASNTNIANIGMSKSADNIFTKSNNKASTPIKLLRSRNYENLSWFKDENLNVQYKKRKSLNSIASIEMSGVALLSETSRASLHRARSNNSVTAVRNLNTSSEETFEKFTSAHEPSSLEVSILSKRSSNYDQFKWSKRKLRKKNWKFWRKLKSIEI